MNRNKNIRYVKPSLEQLEGRDMPSFLLSGAVAQLAAPFNAVNTDLTNSSNALKTDYSAIISASSPGAEEVAIGKATADWARMQNDQHIISAASSAAIGFINAVALTEFQNGDPLDLIVLDIGPLIGLHVTSALTNPVNQANATVNDPTIQSDVNTNLATVAPFVPLSSLTIAQEAPPPSF